MGTLRTKEGQERYRQAIINGTLDNDCVLCRKEAIKAFKHWKIVKNNFPYDRVAEKHDMIVSIRHTPHSELTKEELDELKIIKEEYIQPNYEWILEATRKKQSVPAHFHLHIIVAKE